MNRPLATLAAQSGIGEVVLIDEDELDTRNLNRVRGLSKKDQGEKKAARLKAFIDVIGVSVEAAYCLARVDEDPQAVDSIGRRNTFHAWRCYMGRPAGWMQKLTGRQAMRSPSARSRCPTKHSAHPNLAPTVSAAVSHSSSPLYLPLHEGQRIGRLIPQCRGSECVSANNEID